MNQENYKLIPQLFTKVLSGGPCPPAVDNFDLEKSLAIEFEEVSTMLSMHEETGFEAKRSWQQTKCRSTS